jgi:spore maturation protein CgeB
MKFRLLISGSKRNTNTIGAFIVANFDDSVTYETLEFPDKFATLLQSTFYKVIYRVFPLYIIRMMDKNFLQQVDRFKPDVVLIFKGMEISKWSLKKIRERNIKLVNYNFDHPFEFFSRGTGNRFVKEAMPYYDLHISYSSHIAKELAEKFHLKTLQIPFAYHLKLDQFEKVLAANRPEINRACFVGNPDEYRIVALRKLLSAGVPIDLYGFEWHKIFTDNPQGLIIHQPRQTGSYWSNPLEFWMVLRQYRVQLNFFRPHNEGSHNLRTFEIPAAGGILLTPASREQADFFVPEEEIFFYTDQESLLSSCRSIMAMDALRIMEVRKRAREKSVNNDYSYARRTKDLLHLLEQLI